MFNYILKRILLGIVSLFLLIVIVYFLLGIKNTTPISPDKFKTDAEYQAQLANFGLDKPLITRFGIYLAGLFKGDLGPVYDPQTAGNNDIGSLFFGPLKYTIIITSISFVIGSILGIILGF